MNTNDSRSFSGANPENQERVARLLAELGTRLLNGGVYEAVVAVDEFSATPTCRCIQGPSATHFHGSDRAQKTVSVSFRLVDPAIDVPRPAEAALNDATKAYVDKALQPWTKALNNPLVGFAGLGGE